MYIYDGRFYEWIDTNTQYDAKIIMKYILKRCKPQSVVDFGCGDGLWLSEAKKLDENLEILGLDGDYVDKICLKIHEKYFRRVNLTQRLNLEKKYDLAISTEVAEHIDEVYSEIYMENLTGASNCILFSAAVPGQGGVHHVNERWQSYWIEKFEKRGYIVDTSIRDLFWNDKNITFWRRQNILYFEKKCEIDGKEKGNRGIYDIAHPGLVESLADKVNLLDAELYAFIMYPDIVMKLEKMISKIIMTNKNIVIYPFGRNGRICKKLLNYKYGIQELALADNKLYKKDSNILNVENLKHLKSDFVILETCSNKNIQREVLQELYRYVESEKIFSVFKG